jgi:tetratricopeptide (TPR) repeat protein
VALWAIGNFKEASPSLNEGLQLSRRLDNAWLQALAVGYLGAVSHDRGDYNEAYRCLNEALVLCRGMEDPYITLLICLLFSRTAQTLEQMVEVQDILQESLGIARETGNRWGIGLGLECLGLIAQAAGDETEARPLLEESIALHREIGDFWSLSRALNTLSRLAFSHFDLATAEQCALEAFKTAAESEYHPNALDALASLVAIRIQQGLNTAALEMAFHVLCHPASPHETKDRVKQLWAEVETQLTPRQLEVIQTQAQSRGFAGIVKEILGTVGP